LLCYVCSVNEIPRGHSKAFTILAPNGNSIEIAVFNVDGQFYAISNTCQHQGGPLSKGTLDGLTVTCPWHGWKYSVLDGKSPDQGGDSVDAFEAVIQDGSIYVKPTPKFKGERVSNPHKRYVEVDNSVNEHLDNFSKGIRKEHKIRILGISTTNANDKIAPRKSTSEFALEQALEYSRNNFGAETVLVKLRQLYFKDCEGYYSKDSRACIFPCSISEMDKDDQMLEIYEKMIIWADIVLVATPIRWGSASSLYYKMVQRLNSVENQMVSRNRVLIRDKVAAFIITGGQDNVQHVAGEMMSFWAQLGFVFGKFPFIGWSRGWYAEDTQHNYEKMETSSQFRKDIERTVSGAIEMSGLVTSNKYDHRLSQSPAMA
jgi:nitrite reductase/ring-hydroxylating ferredoxin subunit/multimeric flavodoxin WrbA